ncbi:MAG: hypothetical protein J6Z23_01575 [Lachnospiraceae bacterium]|nr:hypothetical protein [Lachnospiraceae bacterium]
MKKLLLVLFPLLLALGILFSPVVSYADDPVKEGTIALNETKTVTISDEGGVHYVEFTPAEDGLYAFVSLDENYDTVGAILDSEGEKIQENDDGYGFGSAPNRNNFCVYTELEGGKTYRLQYWYYASSRTGSFNIKVVKWTASDQGALTVTTPKTITVPAGRVDTYTFIPEEDGPYYFCFSGPDHVTADIEHKGSSSHNIFSTGYTYFDVMTKGEVCTLKIHASETAATNTLTILRQSVVDDGLLQLSTDHTITFASPSEIHMLRYTPVRNMVYIYTYDGALNIKQIYYLDEDGSKHYVNTSSNNRFTLDTGHTYIFEFELSSSSMSGTGTFRMEDKLITDAGVLTLNTPVTVPIDANYNVLEYSFTPSANAVYILTSSPYGDTHTDTYATLLDSSFSELKTDDDGGEDNQFSLVYYLEAGKTYYYRVRLYGYGTGKFVITLGNYSASHEHDFTRDYTQRATCTEQGYTVYKCRDCGFTKMDDFIEPLGHALGHFISKYPTCTEDGTEHYQCSRCDYEYDTVLVAVGHTIVHRTTVPATCSAPGTEHYYCENCDYEGYDEEIPMLDHVITHRTTVPATCSAPGTEH